MSKISRRKKTELPALKWNAKGEFHINVAGKKVYMGRDFLVAKKNLVDFIAGKAVGRDEVIVSELVLKFLMNSKVIQSTKNTDVRRNGWSSCMGICLYKILRQSRSKKLEKRSSREECCRKRLRRRLRWSKPCPKGRHETLRNRPHDDGTNGRSPA